MILKTTYTLTLWIDKETYDGAYTPDGDDTPPKGKSDKVCLGGPDDLASAGEVFVTELNEGVGKVIDLVDVENASSGPGTYIRVELNEEEMLNVILEGILPMMTSVDTGDFVLVNIEVRHQPSEQPVITMPVADQPTKQVTITHNEVPVPEKKISLLL